MNTEAESPKRAGGWSAIRQQLAACPPAKLLALVKDLHDASPENRDFLRARFGGDGEQSAALEECRRKIVAQFFPQRGFGRAKLADARKVIRAYGKATSNVGGVIELLLTFVENGTKYTCEYGDIDEAFYNGMESAAAEMEKLVMREGRECYRPLRDRIFRVATAADQIGWGYGDSMGDWAARMDEALGDD